MANHQEKQKPAETQKPGRINGSRGFAGKASLVSAITESADTRSSMLSTNFTRLPDPALGRVTSEWELSDQIGAPMRIVEAHQLGEMIGQDEADRFLAQAEGKRLPEVKKND
jgi:hypothetical protein